MVKGDKRDAEEDDGRKMENIGDERMKRANR
jgi:hypothetical protein